MDRKIVIIPTYNEKENIENIIRAIFSLEKYFHILIIEDNSPDGTAGIVGKPFSENPLETRKTQAPFGPTNRSSQACRISGRKEDSLP